jgi:hypothetical protein
LDDAHAGKFRVLIVWALRRIVREDALRIFRQRGCIVVSVKESWLNGSAPAPRPVNAVAIPAGLYATKARRVSPNAPSGFVPVRWVGNMDRAAAAGISRPTGITFMSTHRTYVGTSDGRRGAQRSHPVS